VETENKNEVGDVVMEGVLYENVKNGRISFVGGGSGRRSNEDITSNLMNHSFLYFYHLFLSFSFF
jgi:hypothetical protein